jgi:hypothetical protein
VNDDLHVDLENLQMLQCIICISKKVVGNVLSQSFVLKKGLIKYNKTNGTIPMKTHVDSIILGCLLKENHKLHKRQQCIVMCGNKRRKGQGLLVLLSPLTLGPQTHSKK